MTFAGQFDNGIVGVIDDERIIAHTATHGVGTCTSVQLVVAGAALQDVVGCVADQDVVAVVTNQGERTCTTDHDVFDVQQVGLGEVYNIGLGIGVVDNVESVQALVGVFLQQRQLPGLIETV